MTTRTQTLKEKAVSKGFVVRKEAGAPAKLSFRPEVKICLERARLLTQSYKETEGSPEVIRRAKALANILENMTIWIQDEELIVGCYASSPGAVTIYPEINERTLEEGIDGRLDGMLDDAGRAEIHELCQYWLGKSIDDRVRALLPDDLKDWVDFNSLDIANNFGAGTGDPVANHEPLLKFGLNGIIKKIKDRLGALERSMGDLHPDDYIEQRETLEAMRIACGAVVRYAERYTEKAREMAKSEPDTRRRRELKAIAESCSWVPANPPRTLYEAMQSWYFSHMINRMIEFCGNACGDRLDQLMYPFYKKDIDEGRISRARAQELVECLWIKIGEMGQLVPPSQHALGGSNLYQNLILGGVTEDGEDASNEFSLIMIDAAMSVRSPHTNLCLRYSPKLNSEVIYKSIDCIRSGLGYPSIFNDSCIIPYIVNRGVPIEEARNYTLPGCIQWGLIGRSQRTSTPNAGHFSFGKCFELALNQGKDPFQGKQLGYPTPDPKTFTSIEDVIQALIKQVWFVARKMAKIDDIGQSIYSRYMQRPYLSVLIDGCIERGKDAATWRYAAFPSVITAGATDVVDSVAAIKKFVFDDKELTMEELLDVLRNDFEGHEELRQRLMNEAPKFGNDDNYVDHIAREIHHRSQKEVEKITSYWDVPYSLEGSIASGYFPWGRRVGALPSGKKYRETFADGTISPYPGRDKKGPTAVIKSVGKVPPVFPELLNQRFMPQFLEGENRKLFADYLRTWADMGCWHIQFNVVDDKILLDAQAYPENYSDLVIRVAGYSAYFVDLSKGVQDEIIKRVTQRF